MAHSTRNLQNKNIKLVALYEKIRKKTSNIFKRNCGLFELRFSFTNSKKLDPTAFYKTNISKLFAVCLTVRLYCPADFCMTTRRETVAHAFSMRFSEVTMRLLHLLVSTI